MSAACWFATAALMALVVGYGLEAAERERKAYAELAAWRDEVALREQDAHDEYNRGLAAGQALSEPKVTTELSDEDRWLATLHEAFSDVQDY